MSDSNDSDRQSQLEEFIQLYFQKQLTEGAFRVAVNGLGFDPDKVLIRFQQQVDHQINVGEMKDSFVEPKWKVHGGVKQAGRDFRQLHIDARRFEMVPEPSASPESLQQAYLHRLVWQIYRLPLTGMDPKVATDEGSRELELSAVYTALMTHRSGHEGEASGKRPKAMPEEKSRRLSALEVLNQEPRLALLGDPGSGKSTFVNFVGLCLAGEALGDPAVNLTLMTSPMPEGGREYAFEEEEEPRPQPWDHRFLLPVRIVLRDFAARGLPEPGGPADSGTLWKFIETELGETLKKYGPHLKKKLQDKGGLILLDGLDEVPDADQRRVQVKQAVQGFAADFPRCRFLITSRTYAYQRQEWKLDGFAEAVLSPFTPAQIEHFIERWYARHVAVVRHLDEDDARGQAALLKVAIKRSTRLAELATRPLLLTLMASLHAWRGGSLPEKREELYAYAVDLLLDQWESPKVVRDTEGRPIVRQSSLAEWLKVDRSVVRLELNRLAFEAHRDQPKLVGTADISQERLVGALMAVAPNNPEIKLARLVEHLRDRAGLLAARGEGIYAFPYRTFQEYLAACYLTDFNFPDETAELLKADSQRWREAVLLAGAKASGGTASAVWSLAEALCHTKPPKKTRKKIPEPECWGALVAAQTLLENERERLEQVTEQHKPKLERIRRWLLVIVQRGWLPPVDRAQAGQALAVLGDDRDFDEILTIPQGPFLMGDDEDDAARPRHEVTLPAFKIGRYLVTNAQYRRYVKATKIKWHSEAGRRANWANCPAVEVSWHDARDYCAWLTEIWRKEGKITIEEEVRLPTEAEWEMAARGTDGRTYPWGDKWDESRCNTSESGLGRSCVVGMYPEGASPFGCLDMAGNVWEWTSSLWGKDWRKPYFKYQYNPGDHRENLKAVDEIRRVLRGGSWFYYRNGARCACRGGDIPFNGNDNHGFRVVVSPIFAR